MSHLPTSDYYTMHMGRDFKGGWDKTICFRTRKTETGWISEPVVFLDSTDHLLTFLSRTVRLLDEG